MNRRTFILTASAVATCAMATNPKPVSGQTASVAQPYRRYTADGISCLVQPDAVIFLRNNHPIITYRTTYSDQNKETDKQNFTSRRSFAVPFPCFTRLLAPTSLLPLSPQRASAAAGFICDNIDGVNYSVENSVDKVENTVKNSKKSATPCGQILSNGLKWKGLSEIESGLPKSQQTMWHNGTQGVFTDECRWIAPDGNVQMSDRREFRIVFYGGESFSNPRTVNSQTQTVPGQGRYGIYVTINWYAVDDIQITANRNCLFGVQVSAPLSPHGGGSMMNSNGKLGAQSTFGQRANWMTCWGHLPSRENRSSGNSNANLQEGVAIMSHPSNPWGVSPWNTTPFGYMSPTSIPFLSRPWTLHAGEGIRLRYLILAYTGTPNGGTIDEIYRNYIQT